MIESAQNVLSEEYNNNNFYITPKLIINLCLLFYFDFFDEFEPKLCSKILTISNNNKTKKHDSLPKWGTCYGKKII